MEFRFDANQEFQIKAIEAIADLFDGQGYVTAQVRFQAGTLHLAAIPNRLDIDAVRLMENLWSSGDTLLNSGTTFWRWWPCPNPTTHSEARQEISMVSPEL